MGRLGAERSPMRARTCLLAFASFAALAMVGSGCSKSRPCRDNTVLLSLSFDSQSMQADMLHVAVTLGDATKNIDVPRTPNRASDSLGISLTGYCAGTTVTIAVRASLTAGAAAMDVGEGEVSQALSPTCTALALDVASTGT